MENNEEIRKEDKRAIKEVFIKLVDEEPKELTQEEAIKNYSELPVKKSSNASTSEDESSENQVEIEHLKRVEDLSKKIFTDKEVKLKVVLKDKNVNGGINNLQKDINKDYANEVIKNENLKHLNSNNDKFIE